ncbi:MAG: ABC transporter ATP-binding protein, partial [Fibrobacterales bacterium]
MNSGIQFHNIDYRYSKSSDPALNDCSLFIPKGSIFGLVGPNGAGKTTLLRHITGVLQSQAGNLDIDSSFLTKDGAINKEELSILLENPGVYKRLTIEEYLTFFGQFYNIDGLSNNIHEVASLLDINDLTAKMGDLSLGNVQKVHIARCFIKPYGCILLDEPTSNLDPIAKERVWDLINRFNKDHGSTIIVCTHQLHELETHCTHFGFIKQGHIA